MRGKYLQAFLLLSAAVGLLAQVPSFSEPVYRVNLTEAMDPPQSDFLILSCSEPLGSGITYRIETDEVPFSIGTGGNISATEIIDYETTTEYALNVTCFYPATPNTLDRTSVQITVLPVNEFVPEIPGVSLLNIFISENEPIGTVILSTVPGVGQRQYSVNDQDAGPDGIITFTYNDPSAVVLDYFYLNETTGAITIISNIDADKNATSTVSTTISFSITACDVNPPTDSCPNAAVAVTVFTVNDNSPQFSNQTYNVEITEDTPPGTTILTATCTDEDIGIGAFSAIEFSDAVGLTTLNNVTASFDLNSTTGEISVKSINYEELQMYTFNLVCTDNGGLANTSSVTITVTNVADEAPRFTLIDQFRITNESPPGTQIATVQCVDGDPTIDDSIVYSIVDPSGQFSITNNGEISVNRSLNPLGAILVSYEIVVICTESSPPRLSTNTSISLEIVKEDITPPTISLISGTIFRVLENATIGDFITAIIATDPDSLGIIFSLEGTGSTAFSIDSSTGILTVESALDRETRSSYQLRVIATEELILPGVPKTDSLEITINIGDINDNRPTCGGANFQANIKAGTYTSTTVFTFDCSDSDAGQNGELTYILQSTSPSVADGTFRTSGPTLTFEGTAVESSAYQIAVEVTDEGTPQLSTSLRVTVNITAPDGVGLPLLVIIIIIVVVVIVVLMLVIVALILCYVVWDRRTPSYMKDKVGDVVAYDVAEGDITMNEVAIRPIIDPNDEQAAMTEIQVEGEFEVQATTDPEQEEPQVPEYGEEEKEPLDAESSSMGTTEQSVERTPEDQRRDMHTYSSETPLIVVNEGAVTDHDGIEMEIQIPTTDF